MQGTRKRPRSSKNPLVIRQYEELLEIVLKDTAIFNDLPKSAHEVDRYDFSLLQTDLGFNGYERSNFIVGLRADRVINPHADEVSTIETHAEEDQQVEENWTEVIGTSKPILSSETYEDHTFVSAEALREQCDFIIDLEQAAVSLSPGMKAKLGLNLALLKNTVESRQAVVKKSAKYIKAATKKRVMLSWAKCYNGCTGASGRRRVDFSVIIP